MRSQKVLGDREPHCGDTGHLINLERVMPEQERFEVWFASDVDCGLTLLAQPNALKFEDGEYGNSFLANSAWKAWQAAIALAVPVGCVVVPVEPTGAMVKAGSWNDHAHSLPDNHVIEIYKAMIQAAQENE